MESRDLRREHPPAKWRDSIVAATFILELRDGATIGLDHESIREQSLDDAVQIPWLERHESVRPLRHRLYQAIAMTLLLGEAEQELEIDGLEWQEATRRSRHGTGLV